MSGSGHKWSKSVDQFWTLAPENICQCCIRNPFRQKEQRDYGQKAYLYEMRDIIPNILDDGTVWSELLFDPDFQQCSKAGFVHGIQP